MRCAEGVTFHFLSLPPLKPLTLINPKPNLGCIPPPLHIPAPLTFVAWEWLVPPTMTASSSIRLWMPAGSGGGGQEGGVMRRAERQTHGWLHPATLFPN